MSINVYNLAMQCAADKLKAYRKTDSFDELTTQQEEAVRVMIADAWICGFDAARPNSSPFHVSNGPQTSTAKL